MPIKAMLSGCLIMTAVTGCVIEPSQQNFVALADRQGPPRAERTDVLLPPDEPTVEQRAGLDVHALRKSPQLTDSICQGC